MQLTGNDLIEALNANTISEASFIAPDQATIDLDELLAFVRQALTAGDLVGAELVISGDEPIHLRLESNLINLPLRYVNQISKIVINNPASEVNVYMIVEHPLVSQSGLRIDQAATVTGFLDDLDSVAAKIAAYFDEKIALINQAMEEERASEATVVTEAESEEG